MANTITAPTIDQVVEIDQGLRMGPWGVEESGPAENLEFDECRCSGCECPVAGFLDVDDNGYDRGRWVTPFMDAGWNLWCEDCLGETIEIPDGEEHNLGTCLCDTCDEDRAEAGYTRSRATRF